MNSAIHPSVRSLAEGDFTHVADSFAGAGFTVRLPAPGILQLTTPSRLFQRPRLLVSVGVHGDETAPIEMLAHLLDELAEKPNELALDLMVAVGNPAAIAAGKRFLDIDLNRLFRSGRGELQASLEAQRADVIMRAAASFFAGGNGKWHLDLHTAIRPSHYLTFAVIPGSPSDVRRMALVDWLGHAGIEATIFNPAPAGTFSSHTASSLGAVSATVELGQVGALGANDLDQFNGMRAALDEFVRSGRMQAGARPHVFKVRQELIKHSDKFRMAFDRETKNFTPLESGAVIASDGDAVYKVGNETEYVVFPNPDVRNGLRAGLMVVRQQ